MGNINLWPRWLSGQRRRLVFRDLYSSRPAGHNGYRQSIIIRFAYDGEQHIVPKASMAPS